MHVYRLSYKKVVSLLKVASRGAGLLLFERQLLSSILREAFSCSGCHSCSDKDDLESLDLSSIEVTAIEPSKAILSIFIFFNQVCLLL
jgi:hypothetical protein